MDLSALSYPQLVELVHNTILDLTRTPEGSPRHQAALRTKKDIAELLCSYDAPLIGGPVAG